MITHYGYRPAGSTIYMPWHSFAAATGAPSAASGFASSDVKIYKDGNATERSSTNGITATTDFDSRTGLNLVAIDLSDNSDAGFYAAGHDYQVAIDAVTVDSQTLRFWLGSFSIGGQPADPPSLFTAQMTESYAANGVAPTLAQALFAIHQHLMDFGIAGTARTVKKLDNSTTAFVETLDSSSSPTSLVRT